MPRKQIPPRVHCNATARSGSRCRRYATPGRTVCVMHGAYAGPAGRAAMEERAEAEVTVATLLAASGDRPVWEIILEAVENVDALARAARARVIAGDSSRDALDRLAESSRLAHAMAASAVATKALDMATQVPRQWEAVMSDRVAVLLLEWIGIPSGRAVTEAIRVALGDVGLNDSRPAPRPDGPPILALVTQAQAAALAPRLGLAAGDLTAWFSRVAGAVADGRPVPDLPGAPVAALPAAPAAGGSEGSERSEPLSSILREETTPVVTAGGKAHVPHGEAGPEPSDRSDPSDPPAAEPELLTLHSQAQAEEPEVVDAELIEPEPEAERQPSRIFDPERRIYVRNPNYVRRSSGSSSVTALGYRGGQPTMPTSRLSY